MSLDDPISNEAHDKEALTKLENWNSHYRALVGQISKYHGTMNDLHSLFHVFLKAGHPAYTKLNARQFPIRRFQAREHMVAKSHQASYAQYLAQKDRFPAFLDVSSEETVIKYFETNKILDAWPYLTTVAPRMYALLKRHVESGEPYVPRFISVALQYLLPDNPFFVNPSDSTSVPRNTATSLWKRANAPQFASPERIMSLISSNFSPETLSAAEAEFTVIDSVFAELLRRAHRIKLTWLTPSAKAIIMRGVSGKESAEAILQTLIRDNPKVAAVNVSEIKRLMTDYIPRNQGKRRKKRRRRSPM